MKTSFLAFVGWVLTGFGLGIALMSLILLAGGCSPSDFQNWAISGTPADALILGWANVGHQLGAFVFPAFLFYWTQKQEQESPLRFLPHWKMLVLGAFSLLIGAGCIDFFSALNLSLLELSPALAEWAHAGEEMQSQLQALLMNQSSVSGMVQVVVIIALVPALFEEYFFRGALFQWLLQWFCPWKVMVLTGFIFSLVHFQFEGFLPRWVMGTFLGFLAYRTQSLWPSILAHFVNNLSGILFFYQFDGSMKTPEDHWMSSPIWWGVSVIGMMGVIYWLWKNTRERGWLG